MIIYDKDDKKFIFKYYIEKTPETKDYQKIFVGEKEKEEDYHSIQNLLFFPDKVILLDFSLQKYLELYKAGDIKILNPGNNRILLINDKFAFKIEIFDNNSSEEIIINYVKQEYKTGLWLMKNGIGPKIYDFSENKFNIFKYEYSIIVMQKLNMGTLEEFTKNYKKDIYTKEKINALVDLFEKAYELKFIHHDLHSKNVMLHQESDGKIKAYFIDAIIMDNDFLNFNPDKYYYDLYVMLRYDLADKIKDSNIISLSIISKMKNFPDHYKVLL